MLSGIKFIPRDQAEDEDGGASIEKSKNSGSENEDSNRSKKRSRSGKKHYSAMEYSSSASEDEGKGGRKRKEEREEKEVGNDFPEKIEITRKEMGLDWMLRPADKSDGRPAVNVDDQPEKPPVQEMNRVNPRELNPYLKDNGSGYPDDAEEKRAGGHRLPSSSLVGDGGASWRLKALKRAKEQAAREGRKLEETAAPARAHLQAIKTRQRGLVGEHQTDADGQSEKAVEKNAGRDYLKDVSVRHPEMRAPKVHDSLSWGKRKSQNVSAKDAGLINAAVSSLNKFADDGSFMSKLLSQQNNDLPDSVGSHINQDENVDASFEMKRPGEGITAVKEASSANQLAAKALQLRMKGKHEEADKLMQEAEKIMVKQSSGENSSRPQNIRSTNSYDIQDDEYDFEDGPGRKSRRKGVGNDPKSKEKSVLAKRILTQQERCLFCFENPNRPKHLVVSIANFTYLMLPQWQSVVPGHCCILPMQAIDEAEDEWSQHNAKKLIDTSVKGLRGSIPKDFPYFHVEFGLNKGFVHVIDDETQFKSSLGLNVIRGMLRLPEEDMFRRRRHESVESQKQAVANFARDWEPFDWTKQLD
ncbi:hypothetical protein GH714_011799 [Hevea brasiliensis]|uniref:Cwf19-like C-terminal domain-containing protein n=1 Tax=Hevea brasiliensis TaxID=3981 RepID=A0A6A6KQY8_HEVBR|nr:hypothetical protein GH714_011799 [Hevea brasiliensis]